MKLKDYIRHVPDFPKPGILFYDISPLLADGKAWRAAVHQLRDAILPFKPDGLIGIESRGFLVVAPLALELGLGFVMIRKKGKLPGATVRYSYGLEYGEDTLEIQEGAIRPGQRLVLLDDLLATGGTMAAAAELIGKVGGTVVGSACLIELRALNGRQRLEKLGIPCHCSMIYDL